MRLLIHPVLLLSLALTACQLESLSAGGPDIGYGVTPGGAQDIGFARQVIEEGGVPTVDSLRAEGLLSEHDLPTVGGPCDDLICLRPALAKAPSLQTGEPALFLQVGMVSGLPAPFARPPLDAVAVVDKSSSMSVDMEETNEAIVGLIDQLQVGDTFTLIVFDSEVRTLQQTVTIGDGVDKATLRALARSVQADGPAMLVPALERGVDAAVALHEPERLSRVFMFGCSYPVVGAGESDPVRAALSRAEDNGVGVSYFGVLLGYEPTFAELLTDTRGGQFWFLEDLSKIESVFDDDFEQMTLPLAYDLAFSLDLDEALELAQLYGVPNDEAGAPRAGFEVKTAFVSKRRGAIVARLELTETGEDLGSVSLAYDPEPALGFDTASEQVQTLSWQGDLPIAQSDVHYDGPGVRKAAALVNMIERMRAASASFHVGATAEAEEIVTTLHSYLDGEAEALDDDDLRNEVALIAKLLENIQQA